MRFILTILAALLTSPAYAGTITISNFDGGGAANTFMDFWSRIDKAGDDLVIDAPCVSACTFFLAFPGLASRTCITQRGSLGFHEVSYGEDPDAELTKSFIRWIYPAWVQEWIAKVGGLAPDVKYMWPEDMVDHIPLCKGHEASSTHPETLIKKTDTLVLPLSR